MSTSVEGNLRHVYKRFSFEKRDGRTGKKAKEVLCLSRTLSQPFPARPPLVTRPVFCYDRAGPCLLKNHLHCLFSIAAAFGIKTTGIRQGCLRFSRKASRSVEKFVIFLFLNRAKEKPQGGFDDGEAGAGGGRRDSAP